VIKVKSPKPAIQQIPQEPIQQAQPPLENNLPQQNADTTTQNVGAVDYSQQEQPVSDEPNTAADTSIPVTNDQTTTPDEMGSGKDDNPFTSIQKLTGKLTQRMREMSENMTDKQYKYVINSILSAVDITKLSDKDKEQIMNKLNGKDKEGAENLSEIDEQSEDNIQELNLLKEPIVKEALNACGLDEFMGEYAEDKKYLSLDAADAMHVYTEDYSGYSKNEGYIDEIKNILKKYGYKARTGLHSFNNLDENAKELYLEFVKIGEKKIFEKPKLSEQKQTIYNKMINDIKKKLNKI
jgi:hypothetical protein